MNRFSYIAVLTALERTDEVTATLQALVDDLGPVLPTHKSTVSARLRLADILPERGDHKGAIAQWKAALAAQEETLGPDAPATKKTRARLAEALKATKR